MVRLQSGSDREVGGCGRQPDSLWSTAWCPLGRRPCIPSSRRTPIGAGPCAAPGRDHNPARQDDHCSGDITFACAVRCCPNLDYGHLISTFFLRSFGSSTNSLDHRDLHQHRLRDLSFACSQSLNALDHLDVSFCTAALSLGKSWQRTPRSNQYSTPRPPCLQRLSLHFLSTSLVSIPPNTSICLLRRTYVAIRSRQSLLSRLCTGCSEPFRNSPSAVSRRS